MHHGEMLELVRIGLKHGWLAMPGPVAQQNPAQRQLDALARGRAIYQKRAKHRSGAERRELQRICMSRLRAERKGRDWDGPARVRAVPKEYKGRAKRLNNRRANPKGFAPMRTVRKNENGGGGLRKLS